MDLKEKTVIELRNIAKDLEIDNVSKMKKSELIEAISQKEIPASQNNIDSNSQIDNNQRYNLTSENDQYVEGILELLPDGYGFLRGDNYLSTSKDVYVSPVQIKRFKLDTGDKIKGIKRIPKETEKFPALIYVGEVNGQHPENAMKRKKFDELIEVAYSI